jgi:hypothetical protein
MLSPTEKLLRATTMTGLVRAMEGAVETANEKAAEAGARAGEAAGYAADALGHRTAAATSAEARPAIGVNARVYPSIASFELDLDRPEYGVVEGTFYTFDGQQAVFAWSDLQRCSTYASLIGRSGGPGVIAIVDRANGFMQEGGGLFRWAVASPYGGAPDYLITYPTETYSADGSVWVRIWDGTVLHAAWAGCIADGVTRYLDDFYATLADAQAVFGVRVLPEGTDLSEVTLDWAAAQHAVDRSMFIYRCACKLPAGRLIMSDTLHIGAYRTGDGYSSGVVEGSISAFGTLAGTILQPTYRDRPVVNVQQARATTVRNIMAYAPRSVPGEPWNTRPDNPEAYYDPEWTTGQWNPFCAFAVDAYCRAPDTAGPDAGGVGYPGTYGFLGSVGVMFEWCSAQDCQFCVGLAVQPCNYDGNGEMVTWRGGDLSGVFAVSIGNSQANIVTLESTQIAPAWTIITNQRHGRSQGARDTPDGPLTGVKIGVRGDMPSMRDIIVGRCYQVFELALDFGDSKSVVNIKGEAIARLGTVSLSDTGMFTIIKPVINFDHKPGGSCPAILLDGDCHLQMIGGGMYIDNPDRRGAQIMNFRASRATFTGCALGIVYNVEKEVFIDTDTLAYEQRDWHIEQSNQHGVSAPKLINTYSKFLGGRMRIGRYVRDVSYRGRRFSVQRPAAVGGWDPQAQAGAFAFNASSAVFSAGGSATPGRRLTLTLTNASHAAYLMVGDFAYWQTKYGHAASLCITSVNAGTGVVVLDCLFSDVKESTVLDPYNEAKLWVVTPQFILLTEPKIISIDGADPKKVTLDSAGALKVGDFIFGAWDNAPARILAVAGSEITVSHNVSQDFVGARLFNTRIIPEGAHLVDGLTATSYWPRDADVGTVRTITNGAPITVSLEAPSAERLKLKAGAEFVIRQGGPGVVTFQGINGGVIGASKGNKTSGPGAEVTVRVLDDNTWTLSGDLDDGTAEEIADVKERLDVLEPNALLFENYDGGAGKLRAQRGIAGTDYNLEASLP